MLEEMPWTPGVTKSWNVLLWSPPVSAIEKKLLESLVFALLPLISSSKSEKSFRFLDRIETERDFTYKGEILQNYRQNYQRKEKI